MKIKPKQYAVALYETLLGLSDKEANVVIGKFVALLQQRNILRLAPQIIKQFKKYADDKEGVVDLKIKTSHKSTEKTISEIKKVLPDLIEKDIKKVNVVEEIDEKLLGGFILECDDFVFDSSLKNKLKVLKNNLN